MKLLLIAGAAVVVASNPARAQDGDDYRVRVGLGAQLRPEFKGAEDTEVAPLWDLDIARGSNPFRFEAPDDSFGIRLISGKKFAAGPAANIESSRKNSDVGAPVGKVPTTIEAGAFAEFYASDSFRLRGEILKGIGGHKGLVSAVGADYIVRDADRYVFSVGPRLLLSDGRYQRAFFGVDAPAAAATGLPLYRPDGGLHAVALTSGLSYQFSPQFGLFGFARYERLVGDAAKSPIIREFGSRNQLSGGLGLSYTFTIRR
ncbi:MipA/OmpV family protein [Sphingomonas sp.]|uniref:MipA/OmpV family protein n=1 Tax=Sphingomonas sp. TaxID=28214 RepID=UPI001801AF56|nr:MipA/OmpV family protein [Sphingomonas sp.]MBA3510538.1 MipA/OmpV family protein [Sphingomonas sp.]